MKRISIALSGVLIAAIAAGAAASDAAPTASAAKVAVVKEHRTELGTILVSSNGHTVYEFSRDHKNQDTCYKIKACREEWPPLKTSGKPKADPGVRSLLLSTIALPGGVKQVTYAGHPLYSYIGDSEPATTGYVGFSAFQGNWYAISPAGRTVK